MSQIEAERCNRCGGTGYDPEDCAETMVYTRSGDVDVRYDPVPCRCCKGTCEEVLKDEEI